MSDLTVAEKFSVFMLKNKEKLGSSWASVFVRAAMFFEMVLDGNLAIDEKNKVTATDKVPEISYLKAIYDDIKQMEGKHRPKVEGIVGGEIYSLDKEGFKKYVAHKELVKLLKQSLVKKQAATEKTKKGIVKEKKQLGLETAVFEECLKEVRAAVLSEDEPEDKTVLLLSLLEMAGFLKDAFSKYEKPAMKERMKELSGREIYKQSRVAARIKDDDTATTAAIISSL